MKMNYVSCVVFMLTFLCIFGVSNGIAQKPVVSVDWLQKNRMIHRLLFSISERFMNTERDIFRNQ